MGPDIALIAFLVQSKKLTQLRHRDEILVSGRDEVGWNMTSGWKICNVDRGWASRLFVTCRRRFGGRETLFSRRDIKILGEGGGHDISWSHFLTVYYKSWILRGMALLAPFVPTAMVPSPGSTSNKNHQSIPESGVSDFCSEVNISEV